MWKKCNDKNSEKKKSSCPAIFVFDSERLHRKQIGCRQEHNILSLVKCKKDECDACLRSHLWILRATDTRTNTNTHSKDPECPTAIDPSILCNNSKMQFPHKQRNRGKKTATARFATARLQNPNINGVVHCHRMPSHIVFGKVFLLEQMQFTWAESKLKPKPKPNPNPVLNENHFKEPCINF